MALLLFRLLLCRYYHSGGEFSYTAFHITLNKVQETCQSDKEKYVSWINGFERLYKEVKWRLLLDYLETEYIVIKPRYIEF